MGCRRSNRAAEDMHLRPLPSFRGPHQLYPWPRRRSPTRRHSTTHRQPRDHPHDRHSKAGPIGASHFGAGHIRRNPTGRSPPRWPSRRRGTSSWSRADTARSIPKTPACYGFTIIAKIKPGREAAIREYGNNDREDDRRAARWPRRAQAALPALGALRHRQGHLLHVSGHLRHRLRQVHRGCRRAVHEVRHQYGLREPGGLPGGLEDEHAGVHQVRAGAPAARASWSTASTRT